MGAANASHPLGPVTVSGNTIAVDTYLNQPTRVTSMLMDLTLQRFFADRVFASAGGVSGGAVVYDQLTSNELYATRDVAKVRPGGEFPIITSDRMAPRTAEVEKWGGKVFITDEARDRNNSVVFANQMRQLGNTIVRKINQRAVEVLEAAVTEHAQSVAMPATWSSAILEGTTPTATANRPTAAFSKAVRIAEEDELGYTYNLWIMGPALYESLANVYGDKLSGVLQANGISLYVTNRVAAGVAYAVAEGQVGEMRIEKPLGTETWRDKDGKEITWVQASVRPVMYVTNPNAVLKFTGL